MTSQWRTIERGDHRGLRFEIQSGDPRGYRRIVLTKDGASDTFSRFNATAADARAIVDGLLAFLTGE